MRFIPLLRESWSLLCYCRRASLQSISASHLLMHFNLTSLLFTGKTPTHTYNESVIASRNFAAVPMVASGASNNLTLTRVFRVGFSRWLATLGFIA